MDKRRTNTGTWTLRYVRTTPYLCAEILFQLVMLRLHRREALLRVARLGGFPPRFAVEVGDTTAETIYKDKVGFSIRERQRNQIMGL